MSVCVVLRGGGKKVDKNSLKSYMQNDASV